MSTLILSKSCGFCMGVKNAFSTAMGLATKDTAKKICCYGEIVHNRHAIADLVKQNITIVNGIDTILSGNFDSVIIRAHGVSPTEENVLRAKFDVVDLTCPNVKKVQKLAAELSNSGYFIIILGKAGHPEVKGICGYCNNYIIVKNLDNLTKNAEIWQKQAKIALISQTTANFNDFRQISEYLEAHSSQPKIVDTLCRAPIHIQTDAIELAKNSDLMIIIGDKSSSNTTTLYDLCHDLCTTVFAECCDDLKDIDFAKYQKIGFSAGSSTPQSQIDEVIDFVKSK